MEQIISKEEFDQLMKIKGEIIGRAFKTEPPFIIMEAGLEGFEKVEKELSKIDYSIRKMESTEFYPIGVLVAVLVICQKLFGWNDKKFEEWGTYIVKSTRLTRLFMKYLVSLEKTVKETPTMWEKYYTTGNAKIVDYDANEKYVVMRIKNFQSHPLLCQILKGNLSSIVGIIVGKKVSCKEVKCTHKGDEYHEFFMAW